jgi:hypothetical protein
VWPRAAKAMSLKRVTSRSPVRAAAMIRFAIISCTMGGLAAVVKLFASGVESFAHDAGDVIGKV